MQVSLGFRVILTVKILMVRQIKQAMLPGGVENPIQKKSPSDILADVNLPKIT
jgi:hypothetical protein